MSASEQAEGWMEQFSEREQQEIRFSQLYARDFAHGTDGHTAKLLIAKMAGLLNNATATMQTQASLIDAMKRTGGEPPVVNR